MEAEPRWWAATYTKHVKQKRKVYHDGALLLYPASGRLVLLDDAGDTLESRFLRASEEVSAGASLSFQAHLVDVGEPEAIPDSYPSSASASASTAASGTTARRGAAPRARPPSAAKVNPRVPCAFVNPPKRRWGGAGAGEAAGSGGLDVAESRFQEWTALYTAQLTQKAKRYHDGVVKLVQAGPHVKQIVLLDEEGQVLGSRHLKSGESIESGKKCHFPNYLIEICEAKNEKKGVEHTSEEPMVRTRPKSEENTNNKMGPSAMSKSQKFLRPQNFHDLETKSEVTASSGKPETGKVEEVATGSSGSLTGTESGFKEWNALYTMQLTQKAKKYHDGVIKLMQVGSHARQIVLLDEEGGVLGSRYLKSVESVETGTKCQMPNYLIEVCELRNKKNEAKQSLGEALNQTGPKNEENASDKMGAKSKSPKFVSPYVWKSNWENTTISNRPQIGKTTCSNMDGDGDGPLNFDVLSDLRWGKSESDANKRADHAKSACGIMDDPLQFNDIQRGTSTNSIWPEVGKSNSSIVGDPLQFHDLHDGKSGCPTSFIREEVGKSTFGNMDDSLRTASQILSIMKPPSEVKISQSAPSGQVRALISSKSRITLDVSRRNNPVVDDSNRTFDGSENSGLSHFATQLRTSVQSCLNLETLQRKTSVRAHHWNESSGNSHPFYYHQNIMRPAAYEGQDLAMVDILASDTSNAKEQKLDSSNNDPGSSNDIVPVTNVSIDPVFQVDKNGTSDQLSTQNNIANGKCDGPSSFCAYTLTCKDPKVQELIDDCPSFDLGF
ncbi:uncharacterized protein LOC133897500 isoform X3 [Phragmites australis]|uniref:uncharacterized protein LOC133897500 isoform X3 n=1 Tax=Phragmites australis TaxID=29695 RepID=UPI002D783A09|nr:uncharacterized protein LOC133897500 isoform X3 [Phragmites australis]